MLPVAGCFFTLAINSYWPLHSWYTVKKCFLVLKTAVVQGRIKGGEKRAVPHLVFSCIFDQPSFERNFSFCLGGGRGLRSAQFRTPLSEFLDPPVVEIVTPGQRNFLLWARQALQKFTLYKRAVRSLQIQKMSSANVLRLTFVLSQLIKRILVYIVSVYCHINGWPHHKVM